jgi:hypothetical protein
MYTSRGTEDATMTVSRSACFAFVHPTRRNDAIILLQLHRSYAKERMMADMPNRHQSVRMERAAYHEAGHAVAAASFGCRFGMVALYPGTESESATTGPLQIDLFKCAFPPGQPERLLQVFTILWAGTAAETQFTGRRVAPEMDPDRKTVDLFLERLTAGGVTIPEGWDRRPRLDAHALLRQPKQSAAVEALVATLLDEHVIGHFTARRIISEAMHAVVPPRLPHSRRSAG